MVPMLGCVPVRGPTMRRSAARAAKRRGVTLEKIPYYLKRHFNRSKREWVRQRWRGWEVQRPKLPKAASPAHLRDSGASAAFYDPPFPAISAVKNSENAAF